MRKSHAPAWKKEPSVSRPLVGSQHFPPSHLLLAFTSAPLSAWGLGRATLLPSQDQVWDSSWVCERQAHTSPALWGERTSQLELELKLQNMSRFFTQDPLRRKLIQEDARLRAEERQVLVSILTAPDLAMPGSLRSCALKILLT